MPVIKIFSAEGAQLAAAVMGAAAVGRPRQATQDMPSKPERTRPGNPNGLTLKQHVFPRASIARFAGADRRVAVHDLVRGRTRRAKPTELIFCARRAWDQRSEFGYMLEIEDRFQTLATAIVDGHESISSAEDKTTVERFFALWYARARSQMLGDQETKINGIAGDALTKEQEENLEARGYLFARRNGLMPARQLNGLWLQHEIDGYSRQLESVERWGVVTPQTGEFIITDMPLQMIIPLSPKLALVGNTPDGTILAENLAEVNRMIVAGSRLYYIARDFAECPH